MGCVACVTAAGQTRLRRRSANACGWHYAFPVQPAVWLPGWLPLPPAWPHFDYHRFPGTCRDHTLRGWRHRSAWVRVYRRSTARSIHVTATARGLRSQLFSGYSTPVLTGAACLATKHLYLTIMRAASLFYRCAVSHRPLISIFAILRLNLPTACANPVLTIGSNISRGRGAW